MSSSAAIQSNGADSAPQPIRPGRGATILGPRNVPVEVENPDVLVAPETDAGTVHLNLDDAMIDGLPRTRRLVVS
ncbi:MAG TPA: hypothetical protein VHV75_12780 [Solirubrobacteraceae bacterium]|jgi:hypothetical protein|nr:hypothetical protein [Solirubrobacteraceae bacterium]